MNETCVRALFLRGFLKKKKKKFNFIFTTFIVFYIKYRYQRRQGLIQ